MKGEITGGQEAVMKLRLSPSLTQTSLVSCNVYATKQSLIQDILIKFYSLNSESVQALLKLSLMCIMALIYQGDMKIRKEV